MKKIITNDGSYTFLDPKVKEVYNPLTGAIERAFNVYIFAIEKNRDVLDKIKNLDVHDYLKESFSLLVKGVELKKFRFDNIDFQLVVDDAVNAVGELCKNFDVIILDPFSYPSNNELYEKSFLEKLKNLLTKDTGYLICYNSNPVFVNNLMENGF